MIGRKQEIKELNRLYNGSRAELVAVYGRRRVGKTFLIDETFKGRISFRSAGLSPASPKKGLLRAQLKNFYNSLLQFGMKRSRIPDTWMDAFFMLEQFLEEIDDGKRQVVFLDELPWLDTPRSGFLMAFESFWNNWGCHRNNLMVVVCGSANSWILDKLINNHGGLYNRVTYEIKLSPFTLSECEEFFRSSHVNFTRYDIVGSYMAVGGIPYYLGYFEKEKSLAQNLDSLFFEKSAKLRDEYDRLFSSVFSNADSIKNIVETLYSRNAGYTRAELIRRLKITDGGDLSKNLNALISSDFVIKYYPFGLSRRQEHYKLIDPFCLFYLHFRDIQDGLNERYWQQNLSSQKIISWRGFAFEHVCFNHIDQIKQALGISGVITNHSAWSKRKDDEDGTQIDLLIIRNDNVINMCEIKFYGNDFVVDKKYYRTMLARQEMLVNEISPKISVHSTLITTFGLKENEYSGVFTNVITLDDLFKKG